MIHLLEGKYFQTFIAVLEEKNFSRAAKRLDYVQSTVSHHIQLLEEACEQTLFHRFSKGVKPTEAGRKLAKFSYQYMQLGASIEESMKELDQPKGIVYIALPESFYLTRMLELVQKFSSEYENIKVRMEAGFQPNIVKRTLEHAVDFGIVPKNPYHSELNFYPLVHEELTLITSNTLALKCKKEGLTSLNDELMISSGPSCLFHSEAYKLLTKLGINPSQTQELPSIEMIIQTVKCGMGFAILPEIAATKALETGEVSQVDIGSIIELTHGLIVHKDRELTTSARLLKSEIVDHFSRMGINGWRSNVI